MGAWRRQLDFKLGSDNLSAGRRLMERRLAAILSADMVSYSRHIREDEDGTIMALKDLRADLIDPKILEHNGRIVKLMGDGILVEFSSAVGAVLAATELQHAMVDQNAGKAEQKRIEFRIGINLGDVVIDGDDIQGDGVNIAARLEGLAEPGGICISGSVYDQVRDRLKLSFEDMGARQVKNIDRPISVWQWCSDQQGMVAITDVDVSRPVPGFGGRAAIAVLPFDNLSSDPEQEYFADGIAEDILTSLQAFRSFPVIARNSTFSYKGTSPDVRAVAKELGAGYVLEGSVRKAGNKVRITGQLINADGLHLWAGKYDRDLSDIFAVQDEITTAIVGAIAPEIDRADTILAARKRPTDMTAWDFLLQARAEAYKLSPEGTRKAVALAQKALELDPDFAPAYVVLSRVNVANATFFGGSALPEDAEEGLQKGGEYARKAVALDKSSGFAHAVFGMALLSQKHSERGYQETMEAVRLNPSEPLIRAYHAVGLWANGNSEGALAELEVAQRLSPSDSSMWFILHSLAFGFSVVGRHEEAIATAEKAIEEGAGAAIGHLALVRSLDAVGRTEEAKSAYQRALRAAPGFSPETAIPAVTDDTLRNSLLDAFRRAGWEG
jgi:adenylate cyclase